MGAGGPAGSTGPVPTQRHPSDCGRPTLLSGARDGTRTRGLFLTKEVLCRLSYASQHTSPLAISPNTPTGNRTPVFWLRTRCPGPLDDGGLYGLAIYARRRAHVRRDSNPQPPVLETGALPVELRTSRHPASNAAPAPSLSPRRAILPWPGAESNCRHHDFQSCALPTELPGLARPLVPQHQRANHSTWNGACLTGIKNPRSVRTARARRKTRRRSAQPNHPAPAVSDQESTSAPARGAPADDRARVVKVRGCMDVLTIRFVAFVVQPWRGRDLNPRPPGYEPGELPDCSTPRQTGKDRPGLPGCQPEPVR